MDNNIKACSTQVNVTLMELRLIELQLRKRLVPESRSNSGQPYAVYFSLRLLVCVPGRCSILRQPVQDHGGLSLAAVQDHTNTGLHITATTGRTSCKATPCCCCCSTYDVNRSRIVPSYVVFRVIVVDAAQEQ